MAFVLADRVKETTTTTGTGSVTLLGASTGFQSFAVIGNSNSTYYCIADQISTNWEVGIGTYTSSGTSLSRDTVLASSNSGSLVSFTTGTKDVFVTQPAERAVYINSANTLVTVPALTATGDSQFTSTGALQISAGTTAQRPTGAVGKIRWNSDLTQYEGYNGSIWSLLGGAVVSNDTATSTNVYPLFAAATSGNISTVYTSNANYLYKPSTGTLSTLFYTASGTITGSSSAGAFSFGTLSYSDVNITMSTTQSVNSYSQQIQQNTSSGTAGSADYIVSNNLGTATTYYGDFGITSSGFNTPGQNITNNPNTVYLQSISTDLAIGTLSSGKNVNFYSGGNTTAAMQITSAGVTNTVQPVASNGVMMNSTTVSANMTIGTGTNGFSVGPLTVASGVTITVASGQRHVII